MNLLSQEHHGNLFAKPEISFSSPKCQIQRERTFYVESYPPQLEQCLAHSWY